MKKTCIGITYEMDRGHYDPSLWVPKKKGLGPNGGPSSGPNIGMVRFWRAIFEKKDGGEFSARILPKPAALVDTYYYERARELVVMQKALTGKDFSVWFFKGQFYCRLEEPGA